MATTYSRELERLTHSGLQLADPARDVRDREVVDRLGGHIGTVADVLVDPGECRVRMLEVTTDGGPLGIGRKSHLVPVEAIVGGDPRTVVIDCDRDELLNHDCYQPSEGDAEEQQYLSSYRAFGVAPYWETELPPA